MKTYTEEDMKAAFQAGSIHHDGDENLLDADFSDWFKSYNQEPKEEDEELSFPWWLIKENCGWSRWCDITGCNYYAMKEFGELEPNYSLYCTRSQAEELKLI